MHTRRVVVVLWILSLACSACADPPLAVNRAELRARAAEFRTLHAIRGHFQGGEWRDDVDRWGGRKHEVMGWLGEALGTGRYRASEITFLLGAPDHVARAGDDVWHMARPSAGTHLLVYYWRGHHDFLYFACKGERVLCCKWWMAGE